MTLRIAGAPDSTPKRARDCVGTIGTIRGVTAALIVVAGLLGAGTLASFGPAAGGLGPGRPAAGSAEPPRPGPRRAAGALGHAGGMGEGEEHQQASNVGNAQLAHCIGVAESLITENPPSVNSPQFQNRQAR